MRRLPLLLGLSILPLLLAGFLVTKARAVAHELVDPPFYHPQPLARVEATFRDLAAGDGYDPGGTWSQRPVGPLTLWHLRRKVPAPGVVLLLHGFGDDRWGTSPALKGFPDLDAAIFTYRRRDDAIRAGQPVPPVTFGAQEAQEAVAMVHALEADGTPRKRILLMGRSLGASIAILALAQLEREGRGPLAGIIWEGAPASSQDFAQRLIRGPEDRFWHPLLAPAIGYLGSHWAAHLAQYRLQDTDLLLQTQGQTLATPSLCFIATQDRLASPAVQAQVAARFTHQQKFEVPTWHLHCSEVMGAQYANAIRDASRAWLH